MVAQHMFRCFFHVNRIWVGGKQWRDALQREEAFCCMQVVHALD